jgi:penicillin amidase
VSLNRLLKYINLLVAVLLIAGISATYWFVYRVLPKTSGSLSAPISQPAKITRDSLGVPHIEAGNIEDALFLQGYVTAQDRLWQMDAIRRLAAGELSEVIGKAMLESDRDARRLRLRRLAESYYKTLKPRDRSYLAAYARGVNYFIETHRDALPVEFTLLKYDPRPWSVTDSLLVGLNMFRTLTTSWRDEIQKRSMLAGGEPELVNFLFPARTGQEVQPGSNAWAISGKHTASGKPILANDPHLEFNLPSTWYMMHIRCPEMNVTGATLPGAPNVIVGHNDRIAWGVTNLGYDVQDLYIEKLNAQTGQYLFQGHVEQARTERDLIRVKGEQPVLFENLITRHGPIWLGETNQFLSLRWQAAELGTFEMPFADINLARNWKDFTSALARYPGPAQNFVYADVDGNIGFHVAGRLPIRRNYNGDLPVDGSSGEFEWDGTIPFEELPQAFNPPSGMIVTANQNPFPSEYKYRLSGNFAPYFRDRQIINRLSAHDGWKAPDMLTVQKDVYSALSRFLAQQVVAAYDKHGSRNASLVDAVQILRAWDGQMEKSEAAPLIAVLIYQHLKLAMGDRASAGKGQLYDTSMAGPRMEQLLIRRPPEWFPDYDQLLLRCFVDALEEGRRMQGRSVRNWIYGEYLELNLANPVAGKIPWIGKYFNIGPVQMSGSTTTVKQTTRRLGPSMRMVVDTGDWEQSVQNITIGQSGQLLSWHYKDQWDAYYTGRSFPMRFGKVDGEVLTVTPLGTGK